MRAVRRRAAVFTTGIFLSLIAGPVAALGDQPGTVGESLLTTEEPVTSTQVDDPLLGYGACLAAQHTGDLLLVLDTSGSLSATDPEMARVTAAQYLVERLATAGQTGGFTVDVAVAGFGTDYEQVLDWTPLDEEGIGPAENAIEKFRDKDSSFDTDYWTALEGARQQLADKAAAGGGSRCQAVAWFSDGGLDIEPRTTANLRSKMPHTEPYAPGVDVRTPEGAAEAESAATTSLCRAGGLADQLRASGVVLLGVGLDRGSSADFSLMQSITTGTDGGAGTCGEILSPVPGDFTHVTDIDSLLFAFDRFASPGQEARINEEGVCQSKICADFAHQFVLDASVSTVDILGSSDIDGLRAALVAPDGTEYQLVRVPSDASTTLDINDVQVTYSWLSERSVSIAMRSGSGPGWTGQWSLVFIDDDAASPDGVSRTSIRISGDLLPTWIGPTTMRLGEPVDDGRTGLKTVAGAEVDPADLLGEVQFSVALVRSDGSVTPIVTRSEKSSLTDPLPLDLAGVAPGDAILRLDLDVTTAPAQLVDGSTVPGTALALRRVDIPLVLEPPLNYPVVGGQLDFGVVEDAADVTADLALTGPGCVWIAPENASVVASPDQVGAVTIGSTAGSEADCIKVADGASGVLPVRLTTADAGNGSINGTLTVSLASLEDGETLTVDVPFRADMRKPFDAGTGLLAFILALILGPGVPLALLWVWKAAGAKIRPGVLYAVQVPVTVQGTLLYRDGAPFEIRPDDLTMTHQVTGAGSGGARELTVGSARLRARAGWSPFGPPTVKATVAGTVASSVRQTPAQDVGRLPLALPESWLVWVGPASAPNTATLLVFVTAVDEGSRRRLAQRLATEVPEVVAALHAALPVPEGGAGTGPQWAAPPGGNGTGSQWVPPPGSPAAGPPAPPGPSTPPGPLMPGGWQPPSRPGRP